MFAFSPNVPRIYGIHNDYEMLNFKSRVFSARGGGFLFAIARPVAALLTSAHALARADVVGLQVDARFLDFDDVLPRLSADGALHPSLAHGSAGRRRHRIGDISGSALPSIPSSTPRRGLPPSFLRLARLRGLRDPEPVQPCSSFPFVSALDRRDHRLLLAQECWLIRG